ncbi:Predicted DNA-binding transcriptional regulator YafY, contains an HTH and WYL domains [Amycolatopsis arida]|uniref:Predicted DNA-binding transcriptional regulator YafY, contains an HTH and WYL domains n=1 Tax=Amycolatopsis arida TaxID=587909 RepID=A0A1I5S889_9PSEU|nr:WYL domain-containing protein [Amycolatopsis arida]TDX85316.1 putative DNA-binding transcriptional regulator YafY [Amycolatopsis arida]SFP66913.1 Predicted DNA-binding transcriptional regulator YafY, contains an HTH and WYL domains [Amycolatopsis arida]
MRAERLVALLFTLQSRRNATVPELAAALGVSERTMQRDLATLRDTGVPIWTEPGRHGGVRLVAGWRSRLDGLTSREAVALFAMGVPRALTELGLGTAVAGAHAKVSASLPTELREQAQEVAQRFHLDAPGWFRGEDQAAELGTVARAVWTRQRLRIRYRRGDQEVERVLEPLGLVLKAGVWYLVARVPDASSERSAVRTYRVARIVAAEELPERFDRPPGFDLAQWWRRSSDSFERALLRERARLRLSPAGRRALPGVLGADHVAEVLDAAGPPDADGWIEADVPLESFDIAVRQLLALGPEVEIVAPAELRNAFADLARCMLARNSP